ncbi:ATP-binding cassette domain-containing protein [Petralouisia muris]|uniref:ATP-binding cassette domain-containing protein n=1 Tax=Petralouisia muris TaxID=3032872 RepID=A0AC61RMS9_9FIRM|nr:ATP-binding cassette domain-containing protein [Petralouisia muris]TGY87127.1 ATP-binding cassette domain-containing protein [Petralouisia muris]
MIKLKDCSKKYGEKEVFADLNYTFENEVYWLLGKNGVGKSVFCRCLVGLEKFSTGLISGELGNVLFLPDTSLGEKWLTLNESIDLMLFYYGIHISEDEKQEIKEKLEIGDGNDLVSRVSVGTSMKIGLFLLFVRDFWQTIILDETLSHLDVQMKDKVVSELFQRKEEGAVTLLINHGKILTKEDKFCMKKIYLAEDGIFHEQEKIVTS